MQLELLSGTITGWEGPVNVGKNVDYFRIYVKLICIFKPLSSLGEILYMRSVPVLMDGEKADRFLVLFQNLLLILQISHKLNSYVFKVRNN